MSEPNPYSVTAEQRALADKWHALFLEAGFSGSPGDLAWFFAGCDRMRYLLSPYDGPKLGRPIAFISLDEEVPECSQPKT